ncbi:hypothetical protein F4825DRAFT_473279 [Nemania diffusa]|nr:hypothetical protein F4825DRAFT_473279 [Nemania diffusa]
MAMPSTNNIRSRAASSWTYPPYRHGIGNTNLQQCSDRSMMFGLPSAHEHHSFIPGERHVPDFDGSFRPSGDTIIPSVPILNQFTSSDLGSLSQNPNEYDIASLADTQPSCNSRCTSSVCENENCSENGTPCNDPTCVESASTIGIPGLADYVPTQMAPGQILFRQPHSQPCNHTESEHLVARTLGELRAPGELDLDEKTLCPTNFSYDAVPHPCDQFYDDTYHPYSGSPAQAHTEVEGPGSNESQISLQPVSSLPENASETTFPERHICQWAANTDTPQGERAICGAEFTNTKDFHDHLCEFHVDKLTSQTGFSCLWAGCPRKQERPFVTRGKLRRHISTHSVYKPFTCDICKLGFSGQQALQQHERIHTGLKPFKCTVEGCTMAFKQKSALTMHSRVHTGEKPLQCEFCGKAFPESSNLSKHRKIHMTKTDKYTCNEIVKGEPCGRSFRRLDQLRRHRQTHSNLGRKRAGHNRSMSAISSISGDILGLQQLPNALSGEMQ